MGLIMGLPFDPDDEPALVTNSHKTKSVGKRKRVTFNPIAMRRLPSNEEGEYNIAPEALRKPAQPKTQYQREESLRQEDVNYVFLNIVNLWSNNEMGWMMDQWINTWVLKRTQKQLRNGRNDNEIRHASKEDLLKMCNRLVKDLEENKAPITLKGDAGQLMVYYKSNPTKKCLADIISLQKCLLQQLNPTISHTQLTF